MHLRAACIAAPGCLYTWGGSAFGKLGLDVRSSVLLPAKVTGPLANKVGEGLGFRV